MVCFGTKVRSMDSIKTDKTEMTLTRREALQGIAGITAASLLPLHSEAKPVS